MRIIVCGSRTFTNGDPIRTMLNGFWWPSEGFTRSALTVITGGANGADRIATDWAEAHDGVESVTYPAEWRKHGGPRAGPIRNQQMLDEGQPDLVIAFVNKPLERSVGTFDMVRRSRGAGVPVWVVEVQPVHGGRTGLLDS